MAEIKSTMEMVLERAARMEAAPGVEGGGGETERLGMRAAAAFLRQDQDLAPALAQCPSADQIDFRNGAAKALLRNVVLPRDKDDKDGIERAMQGLLGLGQSDQMEDLTAIIGEIKSIVDRFLDHRDQLRQQLEDQFSQQMAMMGGGAEGMGGGTAAGLPPDRHPKFAEEWIKLKDQLNEQYNQALGQHKTLVEHRLANSA